MTGQVEVLEARHGAGRELDEEARRLFEQGAQNLEAERFDEALASLRRAYELAPGHAQLRSMLGLAIARAEHDFEQARALCESATKQEFFNPDLYLNLSRVYLEFDRRSEAMRYLRRGQMIDPGHAVITETLFDLGRRRPAVVPFLPRRHPLNRALGSARNLVLNGFGSR
jgi:Flp pilus assembly protein TadD